MDEYTNSSLEKNNKLKKLTSILIPNIRGDSNEFS